MSRWTDGLGDSFIGEFVRNADALARLGGLDPLFTGARAASIARWGAGISAMVAAAALRYPTRTAISDIDGELSYAALDRRCSNLGGLMSGRTAGGAVGILCRNHRGFVIAQVAAERAGRDVVLLSTALPAPKLAEVIEREAITLLVVDQEFADLVPHGFGASALLIADGDGPGTLSHESTQRRLCPPPLRRSDLVMLTSGTTGPPKGARRPNRASGADGFGMFGVVPYRVGERYLVASPLFHAWGLSQYTIAIATASTLHLRPRFDENEMLAVMTEHRIGVLAVVPLMLRRMLRVADAHPEVIAPRLVLSSGNVLSGDLAIAWMNRFDDSLYNFYGSTETAIGTIASPDDLRDSPGTVGRAPNGVTIGILDREGMPLPAGSRGRVHLSSTMQFAGYTDGTDQERRGTLMATGDLGYIGDDGLLHIDGRVNDMIVTGGENVFPSRVEEVLEQHPAIDTVAVVGLRDEEYGQRVVAFVVERPGMRVDVSELHALASANLQSFMVPREVRVVDSLPMTTTGKVIRRNLAVLGDADRV